VWLQGSASVDINPAWLAAAKEGNFILTQLIYDPPSAATGAQTLIKAATKFGRSTPRASQISDFIHDTK